MQIFKGLSALVFAAGLLASPASAQEYADWAETGRSNTGTGTFSGAALMSDFTWSAAGGDISSAGIDTSEDWDGTRGIETVYGEANRVDNLNVRVRGDDNTNITVNFNSPTPATGWAFSIHDIDVDVAIIRATDSSNNPVSTATIDSWFEEVFDISNTSGANIPTWDITNIPVNSGVIVGASSPTGDYNNYGNVGEDSEAGAAWFSPNISLNSLTVEFGRITGSGSPSFHLTIASAHAAILTLEKVVSGGTASNTDWDLQFSGPDSGNGSHGDAAITNDLVSAGSYTLSESGGAAEYALADLSCTNATPGGTDVSGVSVGSPNLTLANADIVTCVFTNKILPAVIDLAKTAGAPVDNGDGTWDVEYTITATNSGAGPGTYDVIEDFMPGAGITLDTAAVVYVAGSEDDNAGVITTPLTADGTAVLGETLLGGADESFTITATFTVDPAAVTATSGDCTDDAGENGETGFANNVSGSATDIDAINDDACVELPAAVIDLAKTAGAPVDNGDGTWDVEYTITATNSGAGPGTYDVIEDFMPGAGITLDTAAVVYVAGSEDDNAGVITTPLTADGTAVLGETLLGGADESFTITATFTVDPAAVTATSGDCTDDAGENGETGFANNVSGSATDIDAINDDACVELPAAVIDLAKTAGAPVDNGDGTWDVEYTITATNSGAGPGTYDVIEDFMPGAGITLDTAAVVYVAGSENDNAGVITTPLTADGTAVLGETLLGGADESFTITATFTVDPAAVTATSGDCTDDAGENGETGFANNVSGSATDIDAINDDACVELPAAVIDLAKTAGAPVDNGDGTWDVEYTITATNSGAGPGTYEVIEDFMPGAGITLDTVAVVYVAGSEDDNAGVITTPLTADGTAVLGETLLGGADESFTITATFTVDPAAVTATSGDCTDDAGENGETGFANNVSGSATDIDAINDDACVELPAAVIDLAKTAGAPVDNGDGTWDVEYTITATNSGAGPGTYDVIEDFMPGAGITLDTAAVVYVAGSEDDNAGVITTPLTADGTAVLGETLLGGADESFTITATFTVDPAAVTATSGDCTDDAGENGETGFANNVSGSATDIDATNDDACVSLILPIIEIVKSVASVNDTVVDGFTGEGDTVNYAFTVTNTGNTTLNPISVTDTKVTPVTCAATSLAISESTVCTGSYELTQVDVDAGAVENTADATGTPTDAGGVPLLDPVTGDPLADVTDTSDAGTEPEVVEPGDTPTAVTDPDTTETDNPLGENPNDTADPTDDPTTVLIAPAPSIDVLKSITSVDDTVVDGFTGVGDTVNYEFIVTNTGNTALSPVSVTDSKVLSVTCLETELVIGASTTCTGSYVLAQADVAAGAVENTADATGTPVATDPVTGEPDPNSPLIDPVTGDPLGDVTDTSDAGTDPDGNTVPDPDTTETDNPLGENPNDPTDPTDDPTTLLITPLPSIDVLKSILSVNDTVVDGFTGEGDTVNYAFTVTNTGNTTLNPISVTDTKVTPVTCAATSLAISESTVCTGSYELTQVDVDAGAVENTADATGTPTDAGGTPLIDPVTGDSLADVTDTSDAGTEPEVVEPGDTPTAVTDPDTTETDNPLGENPNDTADPTDDPTTVLIAPAPLIDVLKSITSVDDTVVDGFTGVGDTVNYEFIVTNTGNTALSPVSVTDSKVLSVTCLETELVIGASTTCTGSYVLAQADVAAGAVENTADATGTPVATDPVTGEPDPNSPLIDPVTGDPLGDVMDTSDAGTDPDGNTVPDPDTTETDNPLGENPNDPTDPTDDPTTLLIAPLPSIDVLKSILSVNDTVVDGFTGEGDTVNYAFTVTNTGNTTLNPISVTDTKVTPVTCAATSLAISESTVCTGSYELTQVDVDAGAVENTADATGTPTDAGGTPLIDPVTGDSLADVTDTSDAGTEPEVVEPGDTPTAVTDPDTTETDNPLGENPNDTADPTDDPTTVLIAPAPLIDVLKSITSVDDTVVDGFTGVGDTVNYEFIVTNTGNTALSPVSVTDSKVLSVTCLETELVIGASTTCTGSYVLAQADVAAGAVENTADATGTPVATDPVTGEPDPNSPLIDPVTGDPLGDVMDTSDAGTDPDGNTVPDPDTTETDNPLGENPNDPTDPTDDPTTLLIAPLPSIDVLKSILSVNDTVVDGFTGKGDTVNYAFTVTNTGNTTLNPISVTDTKVTPVTCAATSLAISESTVCTGSYELTQVDVDAGAVENTADATGTPTDAGGTPLIDPVTGDSLADVTDTSDAGTEPEVVEPGDTPTAVTDPDTTETDNPLGENPNDTADPTDDPTTVLIAPAPSIDVLKSITSVDDTVVDGFTGVGDTVNYEFTVTNTGNTTLNPISVSDTKITAVTCTETSLVIRASTTCTGSYVLAQVDVDAGAVENTADATGTPTDAGGTPLIDPVTGDSLADVTDTSDAGTEPEVVEPGDTPTAVTDPDTTETDNPLGENPNDTADPTDDPTTVLIAPAPSIDVLKSITSVDDTVVDGFTGVGDTVNYEFIVTNTGNTALSPVSVTDSKVLSVTCLETELVIGASTTCTGSYVLAQADVAAGAVENTADATGTPTDAGGTPLIDPVTGDSLADVTDTSDAGTEPEVVEPGDTPTAVTDPDTTETDNPLGENPNDTADPTDDPTTVLIAPAPSIDVLKSITSVDDTVVDGFTGVGDTVNYEFIVTNTGNTALSPVSVTDSKVLSVTCLETELVIGASTTCTGSYVLAQADVAAGAVENTADATGTPVATDPVTGEPDPNSPLIDPVTGDPLGDVTDTSDAGTDPDGNTVTDPDTTETDNPLGENPNDTADPTDDPTTVLIAPAPLIDVLKSITSVDDTVVDGFTGVGDTVNYEFIVTNTGNTALSPVSVTDSKVLSVTCLETELVIGASTTCTGSYVLAQADVAAGAVENTADATGTPVATDPVTGEPDPNSPLIDPVTGDPLGDVTDTSDAGTDPDGNTVPDPDTTETDNPLGENPNDPTDPTDDPTTLLIAPLPSIDVLKSILSVNDTVVDGFTGEGDTVNYAFTVTNTGNTTLNPISVTDTKVTPVTCAATSLAISESTVCTGSYELTQVDVDAGAVENTADATGTPTDAGGTPLIDPVTGDSLADVTDTSDAGTEPEVVEPGDTPTAVTDPDTTETDNPLGENPNDTADPTDDPTTVLIAPAPSIDVLKSITSVDDTVVDGFTGVGDTVNYEFIVTNTGNTALSPVSVTDSKVLSVTCLETELVIGASTTCTGSYVLAQADVAAGAVENTADATGTPVATDPVTGEPDPNSPLIDPVTGDPLGDVMDTSDAGTDPDGNTVPDPDTTETDNPLGENPNDPTDPTDDPTTLLIAPLPSIDVLKSILSVNDTVVDGFTGEGDTVNYAFTVTNTGNTALSPVSVVDIKVTPVTCDATELSIGASTTCTGSYVLTQDDVDAGAVENTADAKGTPVATDPATGEPDPNSPLVDPVTGDPLDDVTDSSDAGTDPDGNTVPDPETTETDNPLGENPNDPTDPTDDPTTTLVSPTPGIEVTKSITAIDMTLGNALFLDADDTIQYEFEVTNTGNVTLDPVSVSDPLAGSSTCLMSKLAPGENTTCTADAPYVLTTDDVNAGGVENTATAMGTPPPPLDGSVAVPVTDISDAGTEPDDAGGVTTVDDPEGTETESPLGMNPNDGSDPTEDPTTLIIPLLDLELTKSVIAPLEGAVIAGGEVTYQIVLMNNGPGYATLVEITDILPDGLDIISSVVSDDTSFDPDSGIWAVEIVAPQGVATLDLTVVMNPVEGECSIEYENNVSITAQGQADMDLTNNADSAMAQLISIAAAKTLGAGTPIDQGDGTYQISYVLLIRNNGGVMLNDIQVVDDLQAIIDTPIDNDATIDPASVTVTTPDPTFTLNPAYDGASDTNLLLGTDTLAPGAEGTIEITFTLTPHVFFGRFENQAMVSAVTEDGTPVSDLSEDGASISTVFNFGTPQSSHDNCIVDSPTVFQLDIPTTPITLGWLKSSDVGGGQVLFEWSTEAEVGNVGYYLWSQDASGEWIKLNEAMIESQGDSLTVQDYSYHAYGVTGNSLRITDVDLHGKQVHHGPYQLGEEVGVRSERKAIDWDSINRESEELRRQREQQQLDELNRRLQGSTETQSLHSRLGGLLAMLGSALISPVQATELVNIDVDRAGIYRVTHAQLMDANLDLSGTPGSSIGLKTGNELTPMKLHTTGSSWGAGAYIEFAGRSVETLYTGTNKYTLVLNEGQRLIGTDDRAIPDGPAAYSYLDEVVYAEQNEYTHFSPDKDDAWYADRLSAITGTAQKTVNLTLDEHAPSFAVPFSVGGYGPSAAQMAAVKPKLDVRLWGASALPGNGVTDPDHHVTIELNGQQVADERFDGLRVRDVAKPLASVIDGDNQIKVTLPKDHGYAFDLVNLDQIRLSYPRRFKAKENGQSLVFASSWDKFRVFGLNPGDATVYRMDLLGEVDEMTVKEASCPGGALDCLVSFAGSEVSAQDDLYFVSTESGITNNPPQITLAPAAEDLFSGNAAYLIISHPDFIGANLDAYAADLASIYGSADIVSVESIFAQYSGQVLDANAIHAYVKDAYTTRGTQHVLLVGGDMYDYYDNLGSGAKSFVPSLYVQTGLNLNRVPSDAKYGDVDDDNIPEMGVARLPVRSNGELNTLLSKRDDYLDRGNGANNYAQKAVFSADKVDGVGYSFKADSEQVIAASFTSGWQLDRAYLDDLGADAKQTLIDAINEGSALTSYTGHSSTDKWSLDDLLSGSDVAGLSNVGKPTVVAQWGCWNTFFVSPEEESLSHRFLLEGDRGAVVVMGASSLTSADAEKAMSLLLYDRLDQGMRISDAVLSAKQAFAEDHPEALDVLLGWAVLGAADLSVN